METQSIKDLENTFSEYVEKINRKLDDITKIPDVPQKIVFDAMRYSIMAGGKRIRPVIVMAVTELLGGNIENSVTVGAALECVHTYSLIHDDLPCMDDDDLRRGNPTCHKVYPENIALLAGDGLLNKAFELLSGEDLVGLDSTKRIKLISALSKTSGTFGMIGGQVIDLESENKTDLTLDELVCMHSLKTGALIEVSAKLGCILSGFTEDDCVECGKIHEFASKLGLAFQIKDDILDVVGDTAVLGKPIGSDQECGKNTFVTILGIEKAEQYLETLTKEAVDAIEYFGEKSWFLKQFAYYLLNRVS